MPFCPTCHAEYHAGTATCAECNVPLVAELADPRTETEMADLYVCYDAQQAERMAALLHGEGIAALVRDRSSSAFPTTVGTTAKRVVAVPAERRDHARQVIETAIADGVLPQDGELID